MRQKLTIKRGRTEITGDFLSNRHKQLVEDRESLLNNIRKSKRISFRQRIDNILKRL